MFMKFGAPIKSPQYCTYSFHSPPVPLSPLLTTIASLPLPQDAQRLFHGRGGMHPGCEHLALDWYAPVWLLTSYTPLPEADVAAIQAALAARWLQLAPEQAFNMVYQYRDEARAQTQVVAGQVPEPHVVQEGPTRFGVHLPRGLNHGLFLDMAEGRRWLRTYVGEHMSAQPGLKVLNLFAYTCAFSVVAMQAGAGEVINVDMASSALNIGRDNHRLNGIGGVGKGASFWAHDIFNSWGKIGRSGPYDVVIMDPPSYQKGSFVAEKDYPRLARRLPSLLAPGGHALLCLNSPKLSAAWLQDVVAQEAPGMALVQRLPNPEVYADVEPDRALKVLVFKRSTEPSSTLL